MLNWALCTGSFTVPVVRVRKLKLGCGVTHPRLQTRQAQSCSLLPRYQPWVGCGVVRVRPWPDTGCVCEGGWPPLSSQQQQFASQLFHQGPPDQLSLG